MAPKDLLRIKLNELKTYIQGIIRKNRSYSIIKALPIKKGYKYIIFFPVSAGLTKEDIQDFTSYNFPELADIHFLVEDTRGIKVLVEK